MTLFSTNKLILLIWFLILFISCGFNKDLEKSDSLRVRNKLIRMPGTKSFANIPKEFEWLSNDKMFVDSFTMNTVKCMYSSIEFDILKRNFEVTSDSTPGIKMIDDPYEGKKAFILYGYVESRARSIYLSAINTKDDVLCFLMEVRDSSRLTVTKSLQILESINYVDSLTLDKFELLDYEFDDKSNGFEYLITMGSEGSDHFLMKPTSDDQKPQIKIRRLPILSQSEITQRFDYFAEFNKCFNISNIERVDTLINDYRVALNKVEYHKNDKEYYHLNAIFKGKTSYFSYMTTVQKDDENMTNRLFNTLSSFRIKEVEIYIVK